MARIYGNTVQRCQSWRVGTQKIWSLRSLFFGMCGIFGYVGKDTASVVKTLRGLKDLEYRGYDSWGVAVKTPQGIYLKKAVGKISSISESEFKNIQGAVSLGHTRWATHGGVSVSNAHPHWNRDKSIAVVHNGIIENHEALRRKISSHFGDKVFRSETDTEVVPLLIDLFMERGLSFEMAFVRTLQDLHGRFAFGAIHKDEPFIIAARGGSPLILGTGDNEQYVASDIPAFLDYTNSVYFFENGEYAKIFPDKINFFNFKTKKQIKKTPQIIEWEKGAASKEGHDHFMLKEILEQRDLIENSVRVGSKAVTDAIPYFKKAKNIFFIAMGTAAHMGMAGEYLFSRISKKRFELVYASEFDRVLPFLGKESVVCGITQSGETADLLEAFESAKKHHATLLSVINVRGSSAERESVHVIPVNAGPEKAVASTKAATTQLTMLTLLAYAISGKQKQGEKLLLKASKGIKGWLSEALLSRVKHIASSIKNAEDLYIIGKGINYPIALEAALKIKEVSYIHAEGFAAGELKHGTIALIEEGTPCIVLVSEDEHSADVLSAAQELKARGAYIIGVSPYNNAVFNSHIEVPSLNEETVFPLMIVSQILAYYLAVLRGNDPDKPRNLAKSVTVK